MESWQKTHVALIIPISRALYKYDSDNYRLSKSYATIKTMILATRECFSALKALGVKVTPGKLNFYYQPIFVLAPLYMLIMNTRTAEYAMAKHTRTGKDEIGVLENKLRAMIAESKVKTPNLDRL